MHSSFVGHDKSPFTCCKRFSANAACGVADLLREDEELLRCSCGKEGIGGSRFVSRNSNRTLSMLRLRSSAVAGGSRWGSIHNFLTVLENVGGSNFYSVVI
eukprot:scpid40692/ scgid3650/ 